MMSDRCTTCGKLKEVMEVYYGPEWLYTRKVQRCTCQESRTKINIEKLDDVIKGLEETLRKYKHERQAAAKLIKFKSKEK